MTSPLKGAISRVMIGRGAPKGAIGRAVQGALSRVPRPAPPPKSPPVDPGEMIRKGSAFRGRNVGPIKASPVTEADQTLNETGEGLRRSIGMISNRQAALGRRMGAKKGGKVKKYKEGGKVGTAMTALQKLAADYRAALDLDDTEKAARIKRQMERLKPGSTKEVEDPGKKVSDDKVATFAKGGKVSRIKRMQDILARDFRKAKGLKDSDPVRVRFGSKEDTHVHAGGKKYSFQAGSDDDRFNFRSDDGEEVPVEFSKEWLKEIE